MDNWMIAILPLFIGWMLDLFFGDPARLPHPIVWFGKAIAFFEHRLNKSSHRKLKGALTALFLIAATYAIGLIINYQLSVINCLVVFFCLAGTTLIREVREVFLAVDRSLEEGRKQVARIVGRDTSELSAQEIRTAALETLAENLSDGVIAPLFWFAVFGVPGMLTYKMINTLDSMIGYKTERYKDFGCWAAHIDDIANYIPARLTALLMAIASPKKGLLRFIWRNGRRHASPNSGYPEAALAGILNCRFGGPHYYFGQLFPKPYIGENERELTTADMKRAIRVNRIAEVQMVFLVMTCLILKIIL
jgi:adenosylcobinamide-phosphate synthase